MQRDGTMVMTGGEGTDGRGAFVDRNVFHDIAEERWSWRKDRSYDGGRTWFEGIGFIEAVRADTVDVLDRVEHGYVDHDGVQLHYATMGSGPLVVLLHGFPDFWYTWRHQMRALAGDYRVVAVDLRGYNRSGQPKGVEAYAMRHLIGDVAAVIGHFGGEPATVIGHDWGGAIAWQVALWRPELVDRLVVLSTPHPRGLARELAHNDDQRRNSGYARRFQEDGAAAELSATSLASWVDDAAKPHYIAAFERSSIEGMLHYYTANFPRSSKKKRTPRKSAPQAAQAQRVTSPTLVIHGLDDQALLPAGFDGTWQWIDREVTLVSVPGAGHFVHHDAADLVSSTIKGWLDRPRN